MARHPKFDVMEEVKTQMVCDFLTACLLRNLSAMEIVTVAHAMSTDVLIGCINGILISERLGQFTKAQTEDKLAEVKELYKDIRAVEQRHVDELLEMARDRFDDTKLAKWQEMFQSRDKAYRETGGAADITKEQFERMMRGVRGES